MNFKNCIRKQAVSAILILALVISGIVIAPTSVYAVGWPDYAQELTLGTTVNGTIKEGDYSSILENDYSGNNDYWWHVYRFSMPTNGLLNIYLESGNADYFYKDEYYVRYGACNGFAIFSVANPDELIWRSSKDANRIEYTYSTAREVYYGSTEISLEQGDYYFALRQRYTSNTPYYLTLSYKEPTVNVTSISLNAKNVKLEPGEQYVFNPTVLPDNATDKTITWQSSNPSIASVVNGVLTANNPGTVVITAASSDGEISATTFVKVIDTEAIDKLENSKPKITKITSGIKKATVSFSGVGIVGVKYQVSYKTGSGKWKVKNISGTPATIRSLKSKKTYSVRVRAYKDIDGKVYYSQWSSTKKIKVK